LAKGSSRRSHAGGRGLLAVLLLLLLLPAPSHAAVRSAFARELTLETDAAGTTRISWVGERRGEDVVTVLDDRDGDGLQDDDEAGAGLFAWWDDRPAALDLHFYERAGQVGTPKFVEFAFRLPDGDPVRDGAVRWSASGPNAGEGVTRTDQNGSA
jgi:hypothetical protein